MLLTLLRLYLGFKGTTLGNKGLAMSSPNFQEDLALLNTCWWYVWNWKKDLTFSDNGYIPMIRDWLYKDYPEPSYLLVGNEPNAIEKWGYPMMPEEASFRVAYLQKRYPNTYMIVGNVSYDDWSSYGQLNNMAGLEWLERFLTSYSNINGSDYKQGLGIHIYSSNIIEGIKQIKDIKSRHKNIWLTEYNLISKRLSIKQFKMLTQYISETFDCYAVYTNRQDKDYEENFPYDVDMVDEYNNLTTQGLVYSKFPKYGVRV